MKTTFYDSFFGEIKKALLPMIKRIQTANITNNTSAFYQSFDIQKQEQFINEVATYLQTNKCYIGLSNRSCTAFFSSHEVHITINHQKNNLLTSIFSLLHESVHALYGLQIEKTYEGSSLSKITSYFFTFTSNNSTPVGMINMNSIQV